jgi:PPOX class probable F420-dependent enzyme
MAKSGTLAELPAWAHELLDEARVGHLGMLDAEGRPRVLPVTFAVLGDSVWSAIDDKPKRRGGEALARVRWLRARPESAMTIDRYDADWTRLAWVQLLGTTAVIDASGHDDVLGALVERYHQYRHQPPPGPLLRLTPERTVSWSASEDPGA